MNIEKKNVFSKTFAKIYFLIIFLFFNPVLGQNTVLRGIVSDSIKPLQNANILAFPNNETQETKFAISNEKGEYELKLVKEITYDITISYLGYEALSINYKALKNEIKNFELVDELNALDEVELTYKIPIKVDGDKTTYNTDAFTNGKERKLREVLKKLPGIEVDREGNVTAKGKRITKVLVEDKPFFTGNSKLAVNNIPADAVNQVEILENYNEIAFLKGLQDSDDVALNIKLKEDKKKFVFGDIEIGSGPEKNYLAHPTLFYYSPKTNVNLIVDVNNIGVKSFTFSDYIGFEGGFGKLLNDVAGYVNLSSSDFSQFLGNNDFKKNDNTFGAFNLQQSLSRKTDLSSYVIWNKERTQTLTNNLNTFINNTIPFEERRINANDINNNFVIGKLILDHKPSTNASLSLNSFIKMNSNESNGVIDTNNNFSSTTFSTVNQLENISLEESVAYNKRFSRAQTISVEGKLNYKENEPNSQLGSTIPFLENLLPLQDDTFFTVYQNQKAKTLNLDFIGRDYWVLNSHNHIYTTLGSVFFNENYDTSLIQKLTNGTINEPLNPNFKNDLKYNFNDLFLGLEYKLLTGIFIFKSNITYHNYSWQNIQSEEKTSNNKHLILPQLTIDLAINESEKIRFKYQANTNFPQSEQLVKNFVLRSFNSISMGNPNLLNGRFNSYSLNYTKFNLFKRLRLIARLNYTHKSQSIKNSTTLNGLEQFVTYTLFNEPENTVNGNVLFGKRYGKIKLSFKGRASYNEFFQIVNSITSLNISRNLSSTTTFETVFKKWPNLELKYTYEPSSFRTSISKTNFRNTNLTLNLDYAWKDFVFKADYKNIIFKNLTQNTSNTFNLSNASIFYQKEDNPWGFELSGSNLFNIEFKQRGSFSNILISDEKTFILPRILLFKVLYKL